MLYLIKALRSIRLIENASDSIFVLFFEKGYFFFYDLPSAAITLNV